MMLVTSIAAQAQTKIEVSYFPGPTTAQLYAGIEKGYFAKEGIAVNPDPTNGSVAQITAILDDKYQIGFGGLDDVIGYDVGQGEVPVKGKPDLFAFMGTDTGSLYVTTAPEVKTIEALRGKTVAVDAKLTGFAFVLYHIAALHGLKPGDYNVLSVGSSQKRFEALSQGQAQAAMLFKPVADQLAAKGFNETLAVSSVMPHYQAAVALARRSWATTHRADLVRFIRAYIAVTRWFLDPNNKGAVIGIMVAHTPGMTPQAAAGSYAVAASAASATGPIGVIDTKGVTAAVKLRQEYGEPKKKMGDPKQFYDLSYDKAATKQ